MGNFRHAAVLAAGFAAVFAAAPVLAADLSPSLQSFGASRAISAYELSAPGLSGGAVQPEIDALLSGNTFRPSAPGLPAVASSTILSPHLALDTGRGVDIATRFTGSSDTVSPFLSAVTAPYLALANGGRYAGITYVPADNLRVRLGASFGDERMDRFRF